MKKKEPGNNLKQAQRINVKKGQFNFKDKVGKGDRDDLFFLKVNKDELFDLLLSGGKGKAKIRIYRLDKKKSEIPRKIGKTDFSELKNKDIKPYLTRMRRLNGSVSLPSALSL